MLYEWMGRKPHKRHQNVLATGGRGKSRVASINVLEIKPGRTFEPTPDEIKFFGDLLRPVGESLRVADEDYPSQDEEHREEE